MKISVIVPYHGEELYLQDCLSSLAEQKFKDFEIIIVASGVEIPFGIIQSFQELNIKEYHIENENVATARNVAISNASGKYITFIDCDDYVDSEFLFKLNQMTLGQEYDLVFGCLKFTWYKRSIYMSQEESVDENDEDSADQDEVEEVVVSFQFNIEESDSEEEKCDKRHSAAIKYLVSKKKNMQNITVLGNLFRLSFLKEHDILFNEELVYYCDLPFLLTVLDHTRLVNGEKEAIYIKRNHNDPIHAPSLMQEIGKFDFDYKIKSYCYAVSSIEKGTELREKIDRKFITYYATEAAPAIRKNEEKVWRKSRIKVLQEILQGIDESVLSTVGSYRRNLIRALVSNDIQKVCKLSSRRNMQNWIGMIIKGPNRIRRVKEFIYKHRFINQPLLENVVLFESFFGKSYSDSPKYIYEKLNQMYPGKYECVWILDKKTELPYPAKQIKRFSLQYFKYLARSKYIVFNSRQPKFFVKRKGNVFLETWHGTPLKKLVFDMEEVVSASPLYKKNFYVQSRSWDFLVAANQFSDEVFQRAFEFDKHMLKFGYPRNDILHADNKEDIAKRIKDQIGIPQDKKVVLYAPTWRDDEFYESGKYKFNLQLDLRKMRDTLGEEYVIILRTHYFIADHLDVTGLEGFVFNLSKYDDIAELYLISDILITDYSSVFFDYANLKRPILFFTYDLEKYRDVLRGFYIDMEKEIPGPLVFTTDEIISSIQDIQTVNEKYAPTYETFYERFCGWEDGKASENCINTVFK